jgi:hypothetical protein
MVNRVVVLMMLSAVLALLLSGCTSRESRMFDELSASDFGCDIYLGQSPRDVHDALGSPQATVEKQTGSNVTDHYLPEDVTTTDSDTPQLALTYLDGKLVRLYNRYHPDDPDLPLPPIYIEPLPDVKVGNRKSDFVTALGSETDPLRENEWRFAHKDGRKIVVLAAFAPMAYTNEPRCSVLQVVLVPSVEELKGEELQKREDWRERAGLD